MNIYCPKCQKKIRFEDMNVAQDAAMCKPCNYVFKVSDFACNTIPRDFNPNSPPAGTWFNKTHDEIVIGASTRVSGAAFYLVPSMLVCIGFIFKVIKDYEFIHDATLALVILTIMSIYLAISSLMTSFGKVEVRIRNGIGTVFTGVGKTGWTRKFNWNEIDRIYEHLTTPADSSLKIVHEIVMDGKSWLAFGASLDDSNRYYVLNTLKYLKLEGE
ncbi:zinc ribbon domain-containing protein [Methylobacter luteus]|uniref:hypothetical protein n=1 Tax=Methylobacter luteus TaxID=415 RepID=UPI000483B9F1|nr:hypothetical protein [Methylobacter luteus]